jgi:3-isopropylmalate dehydratase small subunit
MISKGRVWKFGNDVDTDVIIPVQYTTGTDPKEMAEPCIEGLASLWF